MSDRDRDLMVRIRQGDRKAFGMLMARYETRVFNTAYRLVQDPDDAADVTQSVFLKIYQKSASFDPAYKFFSWLYRITVNESLNMINKRKHTQEVVDVLPSHTPTPAEDYALTEMSNLLQRALAALNTDHRVVVVLKHLLFLSYQEIAGILEIPEKTVKSRLYEARQQLKQHLAKQGYVQ